jgi:transcriptional regulator
MNSPLPSPSPTPPTPPKYAARSPQDLADLIASHPLSWVCSASASGPLATPLPLVPRFDADGTLVAVEGHFARGNAQVEALRHDPQALLLWMGPQGYVSPSWMADRTQAPTWNYASAQAQVCVSFLDEAGLLRHLRELVDQQEAGRAQAWSLDEMGARLHKLAQHVIGFRAEVTQLQQRYKLGQDEREDVYPDIVTGLAAAPGSAALLDWMQRFNPTRGPAATAIDPQAAAMPAPRT